MRVNLNLIWLELMLLLQMLWGGFCYQRWVYFHSSEAFLIKVYWILWTWVYIVFEVQLKAMCYVCSIKICSNNGNWESFYIQQHVYYPRWGMVMTIFILFKSCCVWFLGPFFMLQGMVVFFTDYRLSPTLSNKKCRG